MRTPISDAMIDRLSVEAACVGDLALIRICMLALGGDECARAQCANVIARAAEVQNDKRSCPSGLDL